jgi:hypothetical protein
MENFNEKYKNTIRCLYEEQEDEILALEDEENDIDLNDACGWWSQQLLNDIIEFHKQTHAPVVDHPLSKEDAYLASLSLVELTNLAFDM